jgi:prophage antirepressor-like protein
MDAVKIFKNKEFGTVQVIELNGEPMFVGKDVASMLGYALPTKAVNEHVDIDDRKILEYKAFSKTEKASLWQGNDYSDKTLINESGLYSLILSSKLESAKRFKRWVTSEVLPSIRKTGSYNLPGTYLDALKQLVASEEEKQRLALECSEMKPKAEYYDDLVERGHLTNFRDTAKELGMGQKAFVEMLIGKGYVYRDKGGKLKPYAKYTPKYFEVKDFKSESGSHTGTQTLITPDGKAEFGKIIKNK